MWLLLCCHHNPSGSAAAHSEDGAGTQAPPPCMRPCRKLSGCWWTMHERMHSSTLGSTAGLTDVSPAHGCTAECTHQKVRPTTLLAPHLGEQLHPQPAHHPLSGCVEHVCAQPAGEAAYEQYADHIFELLVEHVLGLGWREDAAGGLGAGIDQATCVCVGGGDTTACDVAPHSSCRCGRQAVGLNCCQLACRFACHHCR